MLPSRQLATNLMIFLLPVTELRPLKLDSLYTKLSSIEELEYVDVNEFCPTEAHKKYKYVLKLIGGLNVPCCLLTF